MPLINQPNLNATITGSQGGVAWETAFDYFGIYYQDGDTATSVKFIRNNVMFGADLPEFGLANFAEFDDIFDTIAHSLTNVESLYGAGDIIAPKPALWTETGFDAICLAKFSMQVPKDSPDSFTVSGNWATDEPDGEGELWGVGHMVEPGGYYESTLPTVITPSSSPTKRLSPQIIPLGLGATSSVRLTIAKYNLN